MSKPLSIDHALVYIEIICHFPIYLVNPLEAYMKAWINKQSIYGIKCKRALIFAAIMAILLEKMYLMTLVGEIFLIIFQYWIHHKIHVEFSISTRHDLSKQSIKNPFLRKRLKGWCLLSKYTNNSWQAGFQLSSWEKKKNTSQKPCAFVMAKNKEFQNCYHFF